MALDLQLCHKVLSYWLPSCILAKQPWPRDKPAFSPYSSRFFSYRPRPLLLQTTRATLLEVPPSPPGMTTPPSQCRPVAPSPVASTRWVLMHSPFPSWGARLIPCPIRTSHFRIFLPWTCGVMTSTTQKWRHGGCAGICASTVLSTANLLVTEREQVNVTQRYCFSMAGTSQILTMIFIWNFQRQNCTN